MSSGSQYNCMAANTHTYIPTYNHILWHIHRSMRGMKTAIWCGIFDITQLIDMFLCAHTHIHLLTDWFHSAAKWLLLPVRLSAAKQM